MRTGQHLRVSSPAAPSRSCLGSSFPRLILLCRCDWLSVPLGSPPVDANNNRQGNSEEKLASELNIRLDFSYLLSLSNMVQPHLHSLCIVLDMEVIQGQFHMSRRAHKCSMQMLGHCERDFVLHGGGDTWHPSLLRIPRGYLRAHTHHIPPWSSLGAAD